jgi:TrmH family RNA methyltransferase
MTFPGPEDGEEAGSGSSSGDRAPQSGGDPFDLSGFRPSGETPAPGIPPRAPRPKRPESRDDRVRPGKRYSPRGAPPARNYRDSPPGRKKPEGRWSPPGADSFRGVDSRMAPELRKFLLLKTEKGRHQASRFLIEGAKNIADVAAVSPQLLHIVFAVGSFGDLKLIELLRQKRVRLQEAHPRDLAALCDTETPQGIVAVADFGALRPDWNAAHYVTLIDGVQDPGNLGAILRTSAALGLNAVVLGKGTSDPYNAKVIRSSDAALLRLPQETGEDLASNIHFLRTKVFSVVATSPHAKLTLAQAKLRRKVALLFGNEGAGVGENLLDQADAKVRSPMRGKVESLNVAVSHGLLTYELLRVRGEL